MPKFEDLSSGRDAELRGPTLGAQERQGGTEPQDVRAGFCVTTGQKLRKVQAAFAMAFMDRNQQRSQK